MELSEYCDKIRRKLGYPTVNVELTQEQLEDAVNDAFIEIEPYITDSQYVTLPYMNRIDMSQYNVDYISDIYKSPIGLADVTTLSVDLYFYGGMSLEDVATRLNAERMALSLKDRLSHKWVSPYLYVDMAPPYSNSITIEYVPIYSDVESISNNFWITLILRLALANAKETLGRIRGKMRVTSSPVEVDGDTLLGEAAADKAEIRRYLDEQADTFFPTD
ncbi:neck protein [Bacillus phage SP-15]|uniref:Neck protein n=1 Tax=Bacillus phage SP-15 TaxID=1792032 RepID=A0A127AVZ9_9CAUD|nr:neck protein [Bacillus phage SP-15]AMM44835.1 neck protein [Bacillus phage SP-15]